MLKKRLGIEAIEKDWRWGCCLGIYNTFKVSPTIIVPKNCKRIGQGAFWGCGTLLEKILIPKSVEWIGDRAFWGCINTKIIVERPVKEFERISISAYAFNGCKNVSYVKEETRC